MAVAELRSVEVILKLRCFPEHCWFRLGYLQIYRAMTYLCCLHLVQKETWIVLRLTCVSFTVNIKRPSTFTQIVEFYISECSVDVIDGLT